ncbi:hypothetical protein D3C76_1332570 [compost metagenome]
MTGTAHRRLVHVHQRGEQHQDAEQVNKGQQLEEYSPAPGAALLLHAGQQRLFQQLPAFAIFTILRLRRFPLIRHNHLPWKIHCVRWPSHARNSQKRSIDNRGS